MNLFSPKVRICFNLSILYTLLFCRILTLFMYVTGLQQNKQIPSITGQTQYIKCPPPPPCIFLVMNNISLASLLNKTAPLERCYRRRNAAKRTQDVINKSMLMCLVNCGSSSICSPFRGITCHYVIIISSCIHRADPEIPEQLPVYCFPVFCPCLLPILTNQRQWSGNKVYLWAIQSFLSVNLWSGMIKGTEIIQYQVFFSIWYYSSIVTYKEALVMGSGIRIVTLKIDCLVVGRT